MMILKYTIRIAILFGILAVSCVDKIDFEVPAGLSDSVVIQARVVKGEPSFVEVDVSRLFDFSVESRRPLSVRRVVLTDDSSNEMVLETRVPGSYFQVLNESTAIQAEVGRGYKLRVETLDNRIFESTVDIMPPNRKPIALNLSIAQRPAVDNLGRPTEVDKVRLALDTEVNIEGNGGVYWEISVIYQVTDQGINDSENVIKTCFVENNINANEIFVLDPTQLRQGILNNFELTFADIDRRFGEGLFFAVKQYSLSQGAFRYWNGINILSEREGNIFDGPAGEVQSNFININDPESVAFGYFFATEEEIIREKAALPELADVPPVCPSERACFAPNGDSCICGLCCDCLVDPNATTVVPDFWF